MPQSTPHTPLGGQGWSLGPGGAPSARSTQRECHKVPVLVCAPGQQHSAVPTPPFSPGPSPKGCAGWTPLG